MPNTVPCHGNCGVKNHAAGSEAHKICLQRQKAMTAHPAGKGLKQTLRTDLTPSKPSPKMKKPAKYSVTEAYIAGLFPEGQQIDYDDTIYTVTRSGKPRNPGGGEGKTDVYISMEDENGNEEEFKISIKQHNADFLENKVSATRMEQIAGPQWREKYQNAFDQLADKVRENKTPHDPVKGNITLGYRIDFFNKAERGLLSELPLTPEEKREIYAGEHLEERKRNSIVNGEIVEDSGIAEYLLVGDSEDFSSPQEVLDALQPIDEYVSSEECKVYMGIAAVNLRPGGKVDSSRPLALHYEHHIDDNGEIQSVLRSDNPMKYTSSQLAREIDPALKEYYSKE